MSMVAREDPPFKVFWLGDPAADPRPDPVEITRFVVSIDKFTNVGTGEIPSAQIFINTLDGSFLTSDFGRVPGSATNTLTPLIDQFHEFAVEVFDDNNRTYGRIMYLDELLPQQLEQGQETQLELYGREMFLKKMKIPGHFFFISYKDMIRTIINFYNEHRGSTQPQILVEILVPATSTTPETRIDTIEAVPEGISGIFDFGDGVNCYDALMQVIGRMALPVQAGGAGDYFELQFEDLGSNAMICKIFPLGTVSPTTGEITLTGKTLYNHGITETRQSTPANIVVARGQQDTGRFPAEQALYTGRLEEWNQIRRYDPALTYGPGSMVYHGQNENDNPRTTAYIARTTIPPGDADTDIATDSRWWQIRVWDYLGDIQYSPWTQDKATLYRNMLSHPTSPLARGFESPAILDQNGTIRDGPHYRNKVDFIVSGEDDIPDEYKYPDGTIPEDTRVLITEYTHPRRGRSDRIPLKAPFGDGTTAFDDPFSHSYRNAMAQYRNGRWIVFHDASEDDECAVKAEGLVYRFREPFRIIIPASRLPDLLPGQATDYVPGSSAARIRNPYIINTEKGVDGPPHWWPYDNSVQLTPLGNDCFHHPTAIINEKGLVAPIPRNLTDTYQDNSAVTWVYQVGITDSATRDLIIGLVSTAIVASAVPVVGWIISAILAAVVTVGAVLDAFVSPKMYDFGWWANLFEAPFPKSTHNGIGEEVGELFNAPVIDLYNLNSARDGKTGYTDASTSNDLGQIVGIHFLLNWDFRITTGSFDPATDTNVPKDPTEPPPGRVPGFGNVKFSLYMEDTEDNIWRQELNPYRFLGDTQQFYAPISRFKIYRARNPIHINPEDIVQNILTPELLVLEIFETRRVKRIWIQWDESYDANGRFNPVTILRILQQVYTRVQGGNIQILGTIDAFAFVKAPTAIATTGEDGVVPFSQKHLMENIRDYPAVSNQSQLQKIANADLQLSSFRKDNFTIVTTGFCDARAGDSIRVREPDIIGADDAPRPAGTKKLAVKKINYTVNAKDGPGGFLRHATIVARINPDQIQPEIVGPDTILLPPGTILPPPPPPVTPEPVSDGEPQVLEVQSIFGNPTFPEFLQSEVPIINGLPTFNDPDGYRINIRVTGLDLFLNTRFTFRIRIEREADLEFRISVITLSSPFLDVSEAVSLKSEMLSVGTYSVTVALASTEEASTIIVQRESP